MNDSKNIFVIISGEMHEGYAVRGVYTSFDDALRDAAVYVARENEEGMEYKAASTEGRWLDGGYYIEVEEWPLGRLIA
jgi:hypothetical protein